MEKTYWRSLEELEDPKALRIREAREESKQKSLLYKSEGGDSENSRRDFLKTLGFSLAAAALVAACKRPVHKAIPYLIKPEEITPGQASYYASSYFDAGDYCSVVVKVRDGRPIKIEGNELSSISQRGTSARIQASVLNLYDGARYKGPRYQDKEISWEDADLEIVKALNELKQQNGRVVLLTQTIISPSALQIIERFLRAWPGTEWVQYDAVSASGILTANVKSFGIRAIPDYRFDKAKTVVSFAADFLGTWLSPVEYTRRYTDARKLDKGQRDMLRHYQFESAMSLTGSNADVRFPVKPSEEGGIVLSLYNKIAEAKGAVPLHGVQPKADVTALAEELLENQGKSIVISGSNDENIQLLVNGINQLLGNYGQTILWDSALQTRKGIDQEMNSLMSDILAGNIDGLLVWGVNPVYDHMEGKKLEAAIKKMKLSVSFAERQDETARACDYILPEPNYLESWNDLEPKTGCYSLAQPVISPLFDSRNVEENLMKWTGLETSWADYIRDRWKTEYYALQKEYNDPVLFWNYSLQKGIFEPGRAVPVTWQPAGLPSAASAIRDAQPGIEVVLYESIAVGNGKYANNPWLQELPDPLAKISWDNFVSVPVGFAKEQGLENEQVIAVNGIELPVFVQPGQAADTVAVAMGYGREYAGKVGNGIGVNMFPYVKLLHDGNRRYYIENARLEIVPGKTYPLALSQTHHSMEGRPIVRETNLDDYLRSPDSGNEMHEEFEKKHVTLYPEVEFPAHHWGMAIDLNSCTGCGNCAISCQAENNIQVIGKEQVRNRRIMHWIRVDRYFSGDISNPEVSFQPVMCQHCANAPCENVCPVAATSHSSEGLNQMAYNRCVGTKYCVNNCPYRVRRFNWFQYVNNDKFDYNANNDLGRMVLNPDVTVRSRGVVEKCSMCVQRIQEKKQVAKLEGRMIEEGEIKTACQQSCPGNAIVFGDLNNPESRISKLFKDKRNYHLLEELHTLPSVGYLTKVRNKA